MPHSLPLRFLPIGSTPFSKIKKRANAIFKIISHWLDFFNSAGLNYQLLTDELLKFFAFHQFLGADIEDKGAIGSAK